MMPGANQAERLEGVFAFFEMTRMREKAEGGAVPRASPTVRRTWEDELSMIGGDMSMKERLRQWRVDLAVHRSNAACLAPALAALRASEHAARFSRAKFDDIVAPDAQSAKATERLFVFLREKKVCSKRERGRRASVSCCAGLGSRFFFF